MRKIKMLKNIIAFIVLYAFHAAHLIADDIEIYKGGSATTRPNIMFLLDTSGSMEEEVAFAKGEYDHTVVYPGPFHIDRYYYRYSIVRFGGFFDNLIDLDNETIRKNMLDNYFPAGAFKCQSLEENLVKYGRTQSLFAQWNPSQDFRTGWAKDGQFHQTANRRGVWKEVRQTADNKGDNYVDCWNDIGNRHGLAKNDNKYMTNFKNGSAYSTSASDAVPDSRKYTHISNAALALSDIWPASYITFNDRSRGDTSRIDWPGIKGFFPYSHIGGNKTRKDIFTGNFLNYDFYTRGNGNNSVTYASRMYIMGQMIGNLVGTTPGINAGLARYDGRVLGGTFVAAPNGGMISVPVSPSEDIATTIEKTIKNWDPYGKTPLSESYFEVARYMRGENPKYGNSTRGRRNDGGVFTDISVAMPSVPGSRVGNNPTGKYKSPITDSCQPNHIIIFTDGAPTYDTDANDDIKGLLSGITPKPPAINNNCSNQGPRKDNDGIFSGTTRGHGECADDLAYYLANVDQVDNARLDADQFIYTHTLGGFVSQSDSDSVKSYLDKVATQGQGKSIFSSTVDEHGNPKPEGEYLKELEAGFAEIIDSIVSTEASATAPVVSINAFNSFELSDELYYGVFKPKRDIKWEGNLKRYRLGIDENNLAIVVLDADGKPAVDPKTSIFNDTAQSYWSSDPDGAIVSAGGMASHIEKNRTVFTNSVNNNGLVSIDSATNAALDIESKAASDSAYRDKLIKWVKGADVKDSDSDGNTDEPRSSRMEDPLHSEPTIVTYSIDDAAKTADRTVYIGTNSGMLHAFNIDEKDPKEYFSFIPNELLENLDKYYAGGDLYDLKAYGVDGPLSHWHQDFNRNRQVDGADKVYLFLTLRRGGQSIYALDVTDRNSISLVWQKHGIYPTDKVSRPNTSSGYELLGQSWSTIETALVNWDGAAKQVLFMAGGYDPIEDGSTQNGPDTRQTNAIGNTIYMIDPADGEVLWSANTNAVLSSGSNMTNSFPANVSPVDSTGDGLANILFAADVGGRIWRFDISLDGTTAKPELFAKGGVLADFNDGTKQGNRKFFNEIDVIYQKNLDKILLSVGSGYRAHPLSTQINDYHFILQTSVEEPSSYTTSNFASLSPWGTDSSIGWYIELTEPGEKVLSRSTAVGNYILFSTFAPKNTNSPVACGFDLGQAKAYVLKIDFYDEKNFILDKYKLKQGGIPPAPTLVTPKLSSNSSGKTQAELKRNVLIGTEVLTDENGKAISVGDGYDRMERNYWMEVNP